jgi:hypothetical protein
MEATMPDDSPFIDWSELWTMHLGGEDWIFEPLFARGRGHSLYARAKQGKSLLVLWAAARLATVGGVTVVYLDYEMSLADVHDRLIDMGYGPGTDLSNLHYALIPSLPALNSEAGARALHELIRSVWDGTDELFVVIDTISRAVDGKENSNDTIQDFFKYSGTMLKKLEATWVRLDHAGMDAKKGARGGSTKADDVDVVWYLSSKDDTVKLHRDAARVPWIPEDVTFVRKSKPLSFELKGGHVYSAKEKAIAAELDDLGVPVRCTVAEAQAALSAAGKGKRKEDVGVAVRYRKDVGVSGTTPGSTSGTSAGTKATTPPPTRAGTIPEPPGTTDESSREPVPPHRGASDLSGV